MNQSQWIAFLHRYRVQNPTKYALKYGKEPEEVPLPGPNAPFDTGSVTVEISKANDVEVDFQQPAPEMTIAPEKLGDATVELEKPKRTRKAK